MPELALLDQLAEGDSLELAPQLLGSFVVSEIEGVSVRLRITEVEAYGGENDPASHAYRGTTRRNQAMFLRGGHLYVYRIYGLHWCANVVTGPAGAGQAILLRSGEVVSGTMAAGARRGRPDRLARGPGNLTQAMGITGAHDGVWMGEGPVRIERGTPSARFQATPRVGISKAATRAWRFVEAV